LFLIQNRGFSIIEKTAPCIDAVLFECFTYRFNSQTKVYAAWGGKDWQYVNAKARFINAIRKKLAVWSLDYTETNDDYALAQIIEHSFAYKMIPATTDYTVHRLDHINLGTARGYPDSQISNCMVRQKKETLRYEMRTSHSIDLRKLNSQLFITANTIMAKCYQYSEQRKANYLIEDGYLFCYTGDGHTWDWEKQCTLRFTKRKNIYRVFIPLTTLDILKNRCIEMVCLLSNSNKQPIDISPVVRHVLI